MLRVGSPFDYRDAGARSTCRASFPKPNDPAHSRGGRRRWPARCARALGGRTFVLTTTLRALRADRRARCSARFERDGRAIEVLVQGQWPEAPADAALPRRRRGAVLVGSQSFWEGVDVPGDALQLVVIDKLPFPPPDDPLVEARVAAAGGAGPQRLQRLLRRRRRRWR